MEPDRPPSPPAGEPSSGDNPSPDFFTIPGSAGAQPAGRLDPNLLRIDLPFRGLAAGRRGGDAGRSIMQAAARTFGEELAAAFAAPPAPPGPSPAAQAVPAADAAAFSLNLPAGGLMSGVSESYRASLEKLEKTLQSFRQRIGQTLVVETHQGGRRAASTTITPSGGVRTQVFPPVDPQVIEAHLSSVRLAQAQQLANLKLVLAFDQAVMKLVGSTATPFSALTMLPAIWKFIQQVLEFSREGQGFEMAADRLGAVGRVSRRAPDEAR